jgi:NodT family efflux transporter outer membrane factor (OMF) lipoprotein
MNGATGTSGGIPSSITGGTKIPPFNLYQYGFDASWELDLWGRVRRSVENADASLLASAEQRRASTLSAISEVARDYIELRGIQTQLAIQRQNLGTAQQSLDLTRQRYTGGLTTDLDVQNASAQVRSTQAQIPQLEQQQAQMINAISFLLGLQPRALQDELITAKPVPPVPPRVPVGLPSELARRRPDIRQAEAQLHAATAEIGVAVAAFYPSVSLSGSFSIQALQAKQIGDWDARQYGMGPVVNLPIFQGGQLKATLELRKAQQQEAAATYQRTVLNAWHEVENALVAYNAEQLRQKQLDAAVADSRRALGLAQSRYTAGLIEFLQVLDAQRTLLSAQLQLAQSTTTVSTNLVALYNALGGGWQADYPATPAPSTMAAAAAEDRS